MFLEDMKYTWRRIFVLLHSQIPQDYFHQFEQMWDQTFSLAVQLHVKMGLII